MQLRDFFKRPPTCPHDEHEYTHETGDGIGATYLVCGKCGHEELTLG